MVGVGNRTTTSKVWVHFKKLVDGGKCNICSSVVKGKGGNTSNLEKHLRLKHNIVLKRCNLFDLLTPSPSTTATCTQPGNAPVTVTQIPIPIPQGGEFDYGGHSEGQCGYVDILT